MGGITAFLLAWIAPWLLGTAISLACLKRRYGYWSLAIGSGYLLGLLIALLGQKYAVSVSMPILLLGEVAMALLIGLFFRAKRCTIEEQRLEKAPPNTAYLFSWLLLLLLLSKWLMLYWHIADFKPIQQLQLSVVPTSAQSLWQTTTWGITSSDWLLLKQYYLDFLDTPLQYWAYLPWVGVGIAVGFLTFGGLRYLGSRLLPAVLGAYMIMSLPFMVGQGALLDSLSMTTMAYYLWLVILLAMTVGLSEKRPLLLIVVALLVLSAYQYWLLFAAVTLLALIVCRYLGLWLSLLLSVIVLSGGFIWLNNQELAHQSVNYWEVFKQAILTESRWHFAVLAALISFVLLFFNRRRHEDNGLELLLVGALVTLFAVAGLFVFRLEGGADAMSVIAYFTPLLCLIPITVYHLITHDKDSLPTI